MLRRVGGACSMTGQLWTIAAMAEAMSSERAGPLPEGITGISIDSRTIAPGEAYFAIKGDVHDGHDFVEAAIRNGGGVAVIAQSHRAKFPNNLPLLVVPDVLAGLVDLAKASRARSHAKIIAVTGSVGKTSTKEAFAPCCSRRARLMLRLRRSTITGACRCRWRVAPKARSSRSSRSACFMRARSNR